MHPILCPLAVVPRAATRLFADARVCGAVAALVAALLASAAARADDEANAAPPGMTYESIARLPDFGGWWYIRLDSAAGPAELLRFNAPIIAALKPEIAAEIERQIQRLGAPNPASLPDPIDLGQKPGYCESPLLFNGIMGTAVLGPDLEFLLTPGRVTIVDESGRLIRRVFLNRPLPADLQESSMGTSVGHWESATLVVETAGLDPNAPLGPMGDLKIGKRTHLVERISLKDTDTLQVALTLSAPDVFAKPLELTRLFRRDRAHEFHEYVSCNERDRSVDPTTGRQRFDLTPPADLPPPPG